MNSALLIFTQDSRVPSIWAKRESDLSQGFKVADILIFRMDI